MLVGVISCILPLGTGEEYSKTSKYEAVIKSPGLAFLCTKEIEEFIC